MNNPYHDGELAVQERVGVSDQAARIGRGIHDSITAPAQLFLREQRLAAIASIDARGRAWASLLTGDPGFIEPLDEHTVRIHAEPAAGDPVHENLRMDAEVGIVAIDFSTRRRARLNGRAQPAADGFIVRARQVYANCPRYIQARAIEEGAALHPGTARPVGRAAVLAPAHMRWIAAADTFFIATFHPQAGADASHRGGAPGFAHVLSPTEILFPDYSGNTMFNTLGNIAATSRAGLLFIDFVRGGTLQLTGTAEIIWDRPRENDFAGAERLVLVRVEDTVETAAAVRWRWGPVDASPHNPG